MEWNDGNRRRDKASKELGRMAPGGKVSNELWEGAFPSREKIRRIK
jgi:hypothetical protein